VYGWLSGTERMKRDNRRERERTIRGSCGGRGRSRLTTEPGARCGVGFRDPGIMA